MQDIFNYKHTFFISGNEIELLINRNKGFWKSEIVKGETGTGTCSGGNYNNINEYISAIEHQHNYSFLFLNKGYNYAKNNI